MKNKGFTLVELLAVIVVLLLIVTVITPKVIRQLNNSESITQKEQINTLIDIAKIYTNQNTTKLPEKNEMTIVTIDELKQSELISKDQILNPKTNEELTGCIKIFIENNKYKYEYSEDMRCNLKELVVKTGSGLYESETEPGRYIYRGGNPINNWIELNEGTKETPNYVKYRIVSFEPDGTAKVVREETIGQKNWDIANARKSDGTNNTYCTSSGGCNVWGNQNNTLYNGESLGDNFHYIYYKNATDITLTHDTREGKVSIDSTLNQYLNSGSWIPLSTLNQYIENHEFNVGGIYYISTQDKTINQEKEEERQLKWVGKIGLLNITELAEASLNPNCVNVMSNTSANGSPCKELNWTNKNYQRWTMSQNTNGRAAVWSVYAAGSFGGSEAANNSNSIRPAFYLKSTISLYGTGTESNPYRIVE